MLVSVLYPAGEGQFRLMSSAVSGVVLSG